MPNPNEYIAILRCQTWNVWPDQMVVEYRGCGIKNEPGKALPARMAVLSYAQRSSPEQYLNEETKLGPLVWDGNIRGLHRVRDTVLKAPEDEVTIASQYRNARRGEVDICINFQVEGDPPSSLIETLHAIASSIMSLINLRLCDFLTPIAAMKQWQKKAPDLFGKRVYNHAGLDTYRKIRANFQPQLG